MAEMMRRLSDLLLIVTPPLVVVVMTVLAIWAFQRWVLPHVGASGDKRFPRQVGVLALAMAGIVLAIIALPASEQIRGMLLSLFGLALTAAIALSSTTLVANAMAGIMLQTVRSFHAGDFIRVGEHFGRVTEQGLFHTEIQTGNRDLTTIPNAYLVSNPVTVVRHSGTITSSTVSLGYDVSHDKAEALMIESAKRAGLEEPFVQILELGNYAVTYRVAGLLAETKHLVSARTRLHRAVLDVLHGAGVEIASPTLMAQRRLSEDSRLVPGVNFLRRGQSPSERPPEDIIFDKAEQAEYVERLRFERGQLEEQLKTLESRLHTVGEETEQAIRQAEIERCRRRIARITYFLDTIAGSPP